MKSVLPYLKTLLRYIKRGALLFIGFWLLYFLCAAILMLIPVRTHDRIEGNDVTVYVLKSGVHSDVLLPVHSTVHHWNHDFPFSNNLDPDTSLQWVAIGWGDKNFYMNTPTWGDLTSGTACGAAFGLGTAAVHVSYYSQVPTDRPLIQLSLSNQQYQQLCDYIHQTLRFNERGERVLLLPTREGINWAHDRYYDAYGRYCIFYTCNTWVNNALKAAEQKACAWTPFAEGIYYQYGN